MDNDPAEQNNPYQAPEVAVEDVALIGEFELAGRGIRLGAVLINQVIIYAISLVSLVIIGGGRLDTYNGSRDVMNSFGIFLGAFGGALCFIAIINIYMLYKNGQTIGKFFLGIKIVRTDGSRVGVWRVLILRMFAIGLIELIPLVGFIITLLDPLLIFRESRKCLHDDFADTIVIKA
jgi:uncharacterized RDD family membrane protein YckC